MTTRSFILVFSVLCLIQIAMFAQVGNNQQKELLDVGAKPPENATVLFDGTREMLDEKWTYWEGPRLAATLPLKWFLVKDPSGMGNVLNSNDPTAAGGKYGTADIVTKEAFRDFRLHIEFLAGRSVAGNSFSRQNVERPNSKRVVSCSLTIWLDWF